jgi:ethanolamine-phosphate cytidylyltransferase
LIEAKKMGDFLLVGLHDDATVNMIRGNGLPILNLYERTLSLLSCKYVDEVIIGAPFVISEDLIKITGGG